MTRLRAIGVVETPERPGPGPMPEPLPPPPAAPGMAGAGILCSPPDRIAFDFGTIRIDRQRARSSRADNPVWGPPKTESSTRTIPIADVVVDVTAQAPAAFTQAIDLARRGFAA